MSDVTGRKKFAAFGDQEQRPPDEQPERLLMRAPDGRTVQVMAEDVGEFEGQGFELTTATDPPTEAPAKPKRQKVTQAEPEEVR